MSASSDRGPGRPPGITEATLQKQRRVCAMHAKGIAVETIAAVEECEPAYVRMLLNGAKKKDDASEPVAEREPPQPRRLSRRAAQYRAWEVVQQRPAPGLGLDANAFWIRLIVEIHETGDGFRLGIGEPASRFAMRSDLEVLFARPDHLEIDDWLKALFERGRLIDIGGIDIAIPPGMKLTPAENIRGKKRPAQPPQDGQMVMLQAVPGGLSDATEISSQTQIKNQFNLRPEELNLRPAATDIPQDANLIPNLIAPLADGHAAAAAAYAKESSLLAAAAAQPRAGDARETRIKFAPDATEIPPANPPGATEIILQRSPAAMLTEELVALAKLGRSANADDLGIVETWLEVGETADTLRAGIEVKLGQRNGKPPAKLRYFDGFLTERREARRRPAPTPVPGVPTPPRLPVSGEDQALIDRLSLAAAAHRKDRSSYPWPPSFKDFAADSPVASLAHRWDSQNEGWLMHNRNRDLKPPDFAGVFVQMSRFKEDLLAAEEALLELLTGPDPPEAADSAQSDGLAR